MTAKILIVEDNFIASDEAKDRLNNLGFKQCETAFNGKEAIKKAEEFQPDLILMDINLGEGINGIETAEQILLKQNVPIIYLTAYDDDSTLKKAKITSPFAYIIKPFEEKDLHRTIEIALHKHKTEKKLLENEKKYRLLINNMGEGVGKTDENEVFIFANRKAEKIFGTQPDGLVGRNLKEFLSDKDFNYIQKQTQKRREGMSNSYDLEITNDLNETRHIMVTITPEYNKEGRFESSLGIFRDITEKKNIEKSLKESEKKYRILFNNFPLGITVSDREGNIIESNIMSEKLLGLTKEDHEKRSIDANNWKIIRPDYSVMPANEYASVQALRKNTTVKNKIMGIVKDNKETTWINVTASPILIDKYGVVITYNDISILKKTQQTLKNTLIDLRLAQKIAHTGNWQFDPKVGIPIWSDEIYNIFERKPNLGPPHLRYYKKIFNKHDFEIFTKTLNKAILSGIAYNIELKLNLANHKKKWIRIICSPQSKNSNAGHFLRGTIQEITKLKQNELSLKENKKALERILHFFQKDPKNKKNLINMTIEEALKISKSKNGYIHFFNNSNEEFSQATNSYTNKKENQYLLNNLEYQNLWNKAKNEKKTIIINNYKNYYSNLPKEPKSKLKLVRFIAVPLIIADNIHAIICMMNKDVDYTENDVLHLSILLKNTWRLLQKMNRDNFIREQNKKLLKLNKDKDRFISILAHDLKNPFSTLLGFSNLLVKNIHKYSLAKIEKQVNYINQSAHKTYKLLLEILKWTQAQSGKIPYQPTELDFYKISNELLQETHNQAKLKIITINTNIPHKLKIFTDRNLVKTIMRNLISNAIKFSFKKETINLNAQETEKKIIVSIVDNGVGIKKDDLIEVFNSSNTKTTLGTNNEKGTGLGLQICKEFVEIIGGKIWVESKINKGSTFSFTIPKPMNVNIKKEKENL